MAGIEFTMALKLRELKVEIERTNRLLGEILAELKRRPVAG